MRKIDRYIGQSVLMSILAVLGIILGLVFLFAFIDEMGEVEGGYGTLEALIYVTLTLPRRVYELLPMAALIGCLIGLGTLASSSELTVMRAAGVSLGQIVWAVMKPMLLLMLFGLVLGEYVAPWAEDTAQAGRSLAQGQGEAQSSKKGLWHLQGREFIHINSVQHHGVLLGVTRYNFDGQQVLQNTSFAQKAVYRNEQWMLHDIATTHFYPEHTEVTHTDQQPWNVELTPHLLSIVILEPDALSITGLWGYIHYLAEQNLNNSRYWLAFWTKVLQPMVVIALVLMAISFIFGPLRSVTLGQRVFTGVIVGFTFRIIQDLLGPASQVFGFSPFLAIALPALACGLAGLRMLQKAG